MRRFFGRLENGKIVLDGDEFNHLKNVLRMGVGSQIIASLNDEFDYVCRVEKLGKNFAVCEIENKQVCPANPTKNIVLFQAVAKGDKFEFIIQKGTEIGVTKIVPFESEFCVGKISENKRGRMQAIIQNACKQCERSMMPVVEKTINIKDVASQIKDFDIVLFANERAFDSEKIKNLEKYKKIGIIVGAEGGFSQEEKDLLVNAGAVSVSLGRRIFRCETAAVAMMSLVSILSGN